MTTSEYRYGKCTVRVWKIDPLWHPYPWRFSVQEDGKPEDIYAGIPNQCETKLSAIKRGWYRAKWINEGVIGERYR